MATLAITREVSTGVAGCELTHLEREPIDFPLAVAQHRKYEHCLEELGCRLFRLPGDPDLPDCVFVEDIALVLEEIAIITRPGAESRRGERAVVSAALEPFRPLARIEAPATLDGGDVLRVGRTLYVGLSTRTDRAAVEQLGRIVEPHGYRVRPVEIRSCLHLKSAVSRVAEATLLIQPEWVDPADFAGVELIEVDPSEPGAGNALPVGETVIYASDFERTRERLEAHGLKVVTVDQTELLKAEAGVSCCSLIFES